MDPSDFNMENSSETENQDPNTNHNHTHTSKENQIQSSDFLNNPRNPLYLHPKENPSTILVLLLLHGSNYHSWSRAMQMALSSKNKLCFVYGSMKILSRSDENYSDWQRCNNTVLGWIQRSVDDSIAQSILWIDYAEDAWNDLKDRFSQADIFQISDLQDDICRLEQGNRTVAQYFTELKIL
ncbi:uncharacterized protein LOC133299530 [Gastrolobium bilobum]|uniref:uncharacterized protein LOC133299530 n=1 Tax=Gastrolobium bilobum TaxID=150636 RepID=UPI002AB1D80E|nr:uncharacterized protein LOC133299530 [Gastrolobium bilobum]